MIVIAHEKKSHTKKAAAATQETKKAITKCAYTTECNTQNKLVFPVPRETHI